VERVALNALAIDAALSPDICAFGEFWASPSEKSIHLGYDVYVSIARSA